MNPTELAQKIREKLLEAATGWDCSWENSHCTLIDALRTEVDAAEKWIGKTERVMRGKRVGRRYANREYAEAVLQRIAANLGIG